MRRGEAVQILGEEPLESLLARGVDLLEYASASTGPLVRVAEDAWLPLMRQPPKIVCVGLNYADHTRETDFAQPDYPTFFARFASSLTAHNRPLVRPRLSDSLDYEGEMAVVLKSGGRHIRREDALQHVAGYALFNEASVRDYQFKSPQWTIGKNFDATGAFGPTFVSADELPPGARGLSLTTRLNGKIEQQGNTADLIFDVRTLIAFVSEYFTLEPGDLISTGTPAGVGNLNPGDTVEIEIEGIGVLRNRVVPRE